MSVCYFWTALHPQKGGLPHYPNLDAPLTEGPVNLSRRANNSIWPVVCSGDFRNEECGMHLFKQSEGGTLLTLLRHCCAGLVSRLCTTAQRCGWVVGSFGEGRQTRSAVAVNKEKKKSALKGERKVSGDVMNLPTPGRDTFWRHIKHMICLLVIWMHRNIPGINNNTKNKNRNKNKKKIKK